MNPRVKELLDAAVALYLRLFPFRRGPSPLAPYFFLARRYTRTAMATVLILVFAWAAGSYLSPYGEFQTDPIMTMEQVHFIERSRDVVQYDMTADRLDRNERTELANFTGVDCTSYPGDLKVNHIRAKKARQDNKTKQILFSGDVFARSLYPENTAEVALGKVVGTADLREDRYWSEELDYNYLTKIARSRFPVKIQKKGALVTGNEMEANLDTNHALVTGNVRVMIEGED